MIKIKQSNFFSIKNLHLILSVCIVLPVGLMYGINPSKILPNIFGFEVQDLELNNIFRAMMGLYLALSCYWIIGILKPNHWKTATLINVGHNRFRTTQWDVPNHP